MREFGLWRKLIIGAFLARLRLWRFFGCFVILFLVIFACTAITVYIILQPFS